METSGSAPDRADDRPSGLDISWRRDDSRTTLTVRGELDFDESPQFTSTLRTILDGTPDSIEIHLRDLTFIDSSGLRALLDARRAAATVQVGFKIADASAHVHRVAERAGVMDFLDLAGTTPVAGLRSGY